MKILWHTDYELIDGRSERAPEPVWPDGWPIPRKGDLVQTADRRKREVTDVIWHPHGDYDDPEPYVYVVLH